MNSDPPLTPQITMPGRCACVSVTMDYWPNPPTVTSFAWPLPSSSKRMSCMNVLISSREPSCPSKLQFSNTHDLQLLI